ncbi:GatB/YqeY domain-containing protein [Xanthobacter sp. TB0136]|uniref:GatB/YqeY domain-containing protein n=1 Tax=Xanthobacter sp. TB0136 TaxID=3459177 RepID=UPI00403A3895
MLRDDINAALKEALKAQEKRRTSTLRLINAAIKDRDIEQRGQGKDPLTDDEVLALLAKMVKQREESARLYDEGGRPDLADQERGEIIYIKAFMPQQLGEEETRAAIAAIIAEIGASGIKDMGRTMALLKERHAGALDFGKASQWVKDALTAAG